MALVSYASSSASSSAGSSRSSSPAPKTTHSAKRRRICSSSKNSAPPPPLPPSFANLYTTTPRASAGDDPALHGGRQRSTPHATGTWPSHVYVEWTPSATESAVLASVIASVPQPPHSHGQVHSLLRSPLGAPAPLHISLSRTLPVQTEQKDEFLERLCGALRRGVSGPSGRSLGSSSSVVSDARLSHPRWVLNGERTRAFLIVHADDAGGVLGQVLRACNAVVHGMGWPRLYHHGEQSTSTSRGNGTRKEEEVVEEDGEQGEQGEQDEGAELGGRTHVSIAWTLASSSPSLSKDEGGNEERKKTKKEKREGKETEASEQAHEILDDLHSLRIPLVAVKVRMGNGVTEVPLPLSMAL